MRASVSSDRRAQNDSKLTFCAEELQRLGGERSGSNPVAPTIFPQKPVGKQVEVLLCLISRLSRASNRVQSALIWNRVFFDHLP
jgi:hypothetical protein